MTDEELDSFLISTLNKILIDIKDCKDYVKDKTEKEYKEIKEDYDSAYEDLKEITASIKGIDDLALRDEEDINLVYDCLEMYADNFEINQDKAHKEKDLKEHDKILEILNLFIDTEDFEDEEI